MSSNSIDKLLNLSAPAAKPAPQSSSRDDGEQFDRYLRQAAKTSTSPGPPDNSQRPSAPAKKSDDALSKGDKDSTASSDDDKVPTDGIEVAEVSDDDAPETIEADEVLISAAALATQQAESVETIVVPSEVDVQLAVQPQNTSDENQLQESQNSNSQAATQSFGDLLFGKTADSPTEVESTATAQDASADSTLLVGTKAEAATNGTQTSTNTAAAVQAASQGQTVKDPKPENTHHDPRDKSRASEQDAAENLIGQIAIANLQTVDNELADLVSDTANSADDNKAKSPEPVKSHANNDATNTLTTQQLNAPTGNSDLHTASSDRDSQSGTIDRSRFVQRVANAFRSAQQNDGHIQMKLSPPELGQLRIEIAVRHGVLTANMETETADARRLLLDNLPALRQRLAEQDIRIERFDVDVRREGSQSEGQAGAQDKQAQQQSQRATAQNRIPQPDNSRLIAARVAQTGLNSTNVGLDIRI